MVRKGTRESQQFFKHWLKMLEDESREKERTILEIIARLDIHDWLKTYSEMHFHVIAAVYNSNGISRGAIWRKIGKEPVREDSPEAGLYRLLIRDLTIGGIIRQHREKDMHGTGGLTNG